MNIYFWWRCWERGVGVHTFEIRHFSFFEIGHFSVPKVSRLYIFNLPYVFVDTLKHYKDSKHIAVHHKGRYYKVYIHYKGRFLKPCEIEV